jgi:hypothetical protein
VLVFPLKVVGSPPGEQMATPAGSRVLLHTKNTEHKAASAWVSTG